MRAETQSARECPELAAALNDLQRFAQGSVSAVPGNHDSITFLSPWKSLAKVVERRGDIYEMSTICTEMYGQWSEIRCDQVV